MNTARDNFYFVTDVMEMLGLSRAACYKIIKKLNSELEAEGYITVSGRVPKRYYNQRLFCGPEQTEAATHESTTRTTRGKVISLPNAMRR